VSTATVDQSIAILDGALADAVASAPEARVLASSPAG
jgi:hypothetical protein